MFRGLTESLLLMETTLLKGPDWLGVNVTFALQQLLGAIFRLDMLSGGGAVTEEATKPDDPENCKVEETGVEGDVAKLRK